MSAPDPVTALRLAKRLIDEALPHFDWSRSALPVEAIRLLNDVPGAVSAALAAADDAAEAVVPVPRKRGPLSESDVDALRLDLDAGTLLILSRDRGSRASAALSAAGAETALLEHEEAHLVWVAVAACLRTFPAEQPATEGPAS